MKSIAVYTLALLLVTPVLARPNLVEPIYLRRRSNPLEIIEESVESNGSSQDSTDPSSTEKQPSSSSAGTTETATDIGSSSSSSSSTSPSTSTHQPRYQTTNDGLSSDSLIKEFLLKNLANLQGQSLAPVAAPVSADLTGSEEQNTLRSVSLGVSGLSYPPLPNWDPPEKTYVYPVKTHYPVVGSPLEVEIGQKRKPIIHKIITKWSDKTADVFNVEYGTPAADLLRPSSQIYSNFAAATTPVSNDAVEHQQHLYGAFGSPEVLSTNFHTPSEEVYQQGPGPIVSDQLTPFGSHGTKNKPKKHKKKNKIKITIKPTPTPVKVTAQPLSDPDRPDAVYSGEQSPAGGWNPYEPDPYDEVQDANPYDEFGNLKGEEIVDTVSECNEITISMSGKQGCNEIQIGINEDNPSLTKLGPGAASVLPGAAVAAAAVGTAGALSAAPQASAALPAAAVASDVAFAAPLAAAAPLAVNPIVPLVPAAVPAPVTNFLNTPISNLVGNIIRPVRIGAAGQQAATIGNGVGSNQNKLKPKPSKVSHDHGSSLLPDMSHALLGMMAAVSAMTPMNMFVLGLTSLPVLAMIVGTVAAGMYMYKAYYPTPVRHYTTTVLVQKKPPVSFHWVRKPASTRPRPVYTSTWSDYDPHSWGPAAGWDNDRRSMRHSSDPFAFKRPELLKTKLGTSGFVVSTSTKVLTGGASAASAASQRPRPGLVVGSGEAKANDRYSGHAGVAEPMTDEEYQSELHRATERVPPRTTTPREGLSTWVLLSGSDSGERKSESTTSTTTTATTTTLKSTTPAKRFQPTTRRVPPSPTARPARTTTPAAAGGSEEKKEKLNKPLPKQKTVSTTLKPVIVKKVKKPPVTTTTTTTTTTPKPTTTATPTTTTEMVITEQSASTTANDLAAPVTDDSSVESSTFLILEPKDALFDLPEDRSPAKTAPAAGGAKVPKKPTRKTNVKAPGTKKKPAGNKKTRKPEVKDVVASDKKPANKNKPVSTQIINYLSREVMPTVGVGLVGLVMAAGLASYFLGSPLGALRRSDDRKDDLYYTNYEEYAGPDGQNEEDVFGKLIAGMPDRSYYRNNAVRRRTQVQPVRTGHQYYHVQPYSANKYPPIQYRNRAYAGGAPGGPSPQDPMYTNVNQRQGQAKAQHEFYYNTPPTAYAPMRTVAAEAPVYSTSAVAVTTTSTASPPVVAQSDPEPDHEMMPHPEAYSAEHSPEHHAQYVVGTSYSDSMLDMINAASVPEHGPRRKRRAVASDEDDELLANEIDVDEVRPKDGPAQSGEVTEMPGDAETTTASVPETTTAAGHRYTWGDFIRNTVERKVAMGINFLQHVTLDFQRYLSGVHDRFQVMQHPHHNQTSAPSAERRH
uniref:Mucin-5AC n=1 Tax=Anopheles dirus TaxID=7168 RepID=A0A182N527_9DIPT